MRRGIFSVVLTAIILLLLTTVVYGDPQPSPKKEMDGFELFPINKTKWQEGPPSLPKGVMIAVLEGDPTKEGPFVFRLKLPDGYRVPPHTHPRVERITVLAGTLNVGMGNKFDEKTTKAMTTGTYGHWTAGMKHFVWAKGETILQYHGSGPWTIEYVNPEEKPRKQKK